jgi:peptide/nickel transport system permease protein
VPVVLGVSVLVFSMVYLLPGDPAQAIAGTQVLDRETLEILRKQLGLNDPAPVQYARFLINALHGDLGRSTLSQRPVINEILTNLPSTLQLTGAAMCLAILIGMSLGAAAAIRHNSWIDHLTMLMALTGVSVPGFWLGVLAILLFSVVLGWLPPSGSQGAERLVMPAGVLGLSAAGIIARLTRSSMLEVLRQDYITTARAKGLRQLAVIYRHALKNALIPVLTIVGLQVGTLLAGSVVIETVFSRRGIGRLLIEGILARDFPLVQGLVLFTATSYVAVNLIVDLLYAYVDPRIRYH